MTNERPRINLAAIEASISAESTVSESIGLMEDAFREAVKHRYGHYFSGPEERETRRRLEALMKGYFEAKGSRPEALAYTQPAAIVEMIKVMSTSSRSNEAMLTEQAKQQAAIAARPQWQTDVLERDTEEQIQKRMLAEKTDLTSGHGKGWLKESLADAALSDAEREEMIQGAMPAKKAE